MTMQPETSIAVIIPAYKAQGTLRAVVEAIPPTIRHIIIVDDKSPDETWALIQNLAASDPRVVALQNEVNLGVGGAMKTGFQEALRQGADIAVKIDSDGQMDPAYLPALIQPILEGKAEYCKGNRFLDSTALRQMPAIRRAGNLALSFLTKLASGYWQIFDPTNGYTAISAAALANLNFDELEDRYFFETSMLCELYYQRARVQDVAIPAKYGSEKSSLSVPYSILEFSVKLLGRFFTRIGRAYYLRDFTAVSLLLFAGLLSVGFGAVWGAFHWIASIRTGVAASTGTVMIAVLPLIMGFQMLLQALVLDIQNSPGGRPEH